MILAYLVVHQIKSGVYISLKVTIEQPRCIPELEAKTQEEERQRFFFENTQMIIQLTGIQQ